MTADLTSTIRPHTDAELAEEQVHGWIQRQGFGDRQSLWLGTLSARATVWVAALRLAYSSDRHSEELLKLAKQEVRRRHVAHQLRNPMLFPDERAELLHQHRMLDRVWLPLEMTKPPVNWMTEVPSAG